MLMDKIVVAFFLFLINIPVTRGSPIPGRSTETEDLILILALTFLYFKRIQRSRKPPVVWKNSYLKDRSLKGRYNRDFSDLKANPAAFRENFHVTPAQFDALLEMLHDKLKPKKKSRKSDSICAAEKLCVTLEFLASGSLQRHVASVYRISKQRIGPIIESTCELIYEALRADNIPKLSRKKWVQISNDFHAHWNYPNCLGAIDGKHVAIKCPDNAGSQFYNYKGFHSVVLMAVADSEYKFLYVDIGSYGSEGDSSIFRKCEFGRALSNGTLQLPDDLPVHGKEIPHMFIADDAFPLTHRIMKPYKPKRKGEPLNKEQSVFNYRLSRARRCVENAFGILCVKWICLARTLFMNTVRAQKVVAACCVLHNWLMKDRQGTYCPPGFADYESPDGTIKFGTWRTLIPDNSMFHSELSTQNSGRPTQKAQDIRNHLKDYFSSPNGKLTWQDQKVFHT